MSAPRSARIGPKQELPVPLSLRTGPGGFSFGGAPALARQPIFEAILQNNLTLTRAGGASTPTFTRATTGSIEDFEGLIKTAIAGESRFKGARRVENLISASEDMTNGVWTVAGSATATATTVEFDGTNNADVLQNITITDDGGGAASRTWVFSVFIKLLSGTISGDSGITLRVGGNAVTAASTEIGSDITSSSLRFSVDFTNDAAGTTIIPELECDDAVTLEITKWQVEETTGQSNRNPGEYVSVGVATGEEVLSTNQMKASNWTPAGTNTVADVAGATGDEVLITYVDNAGGATLDIGNLQSDLEADTVRTWVITGQVKVDAGDSVVILMDNESPAVTQTITSTTYVDFTFVTSYDGSGNLTLFVNSMGAGETINVKDVSVKPADHGANLDGIQYFLRFNGNTVLNNVVTETLGAEIHSGTAKFSQHSGKVTAHWSTPDSATASITGDIELQFDALSVDWTSGAAQTLACKDDNTSGNREWSFVITGDGKLRFGYAADGDTPSGFSSSVVAGFTDGVRHKGKVTRSAATGDIKFYTFIGNAYVQLGSTVSSSVEGIFDGGALVRIGSLFGNLFPLIGRIYSLQVYNGIDGTLAVDFNPNLDTNDDNDFTASTGEVWTARGNATIYSGFWDTDGPFGYLSEGARTNVALHTKALGDVVWTVDDVTIDDDAAVGPDGTLTADRVNITVSTSVHDVSDTNLTNTSGRDVSFSAYVKYDGEQHIILNLSTSAEDHISAVYDIQAGSVTATDVGTTSGTVGSTDITALPNGWFRVQLNGSIAEAAALVWSIGGAQGATPTFDSLGQVSYLGVAGEDFFATDIQVEDNVTFSSSRIPTTSSSVTRNADVLTYDDVGNFQDAAGTAFARVTSEWGTSAGRSHILARDVNGRILWRDVSSPSTVIQTSDGTATSSSPTGTSYENAPQKGASTWSSSSDQLLAYLNGVPDVSPAVYDDTMGTGDLAIGCTNTGGEHWFGTVSIVQIYDIDFTVSQVVSH